MLRNLRSLIYFAPDFLGNFQDLYLFSSANRFDIKGTKTLKDVSFHLPESQLCLGVMDIVTLLYLTVISSSNMLKYFFFCLRLETYKEFHIDKKFAGVKAQFSTVIQSWLDL